LVDPTVHARAALRRWFRGSYAAGGLVHPVRYVLDRAGLPVTALPPAALDHDDATLFIPDESDDALQLHVHPRRLDESDPAVDRYLIYHGPAEGRVWAGLDVLGARLGSAVFDGEEVSVSSPWSSVEPVLCRRLNADRALLSRAVKTDDPSVRAVGVDPWGMDVRLRWEVLRVPWLRSQEGVGPEQAAEAVDTQVRALAGS
jgi:hypothetical protein